MEKKEVIGAVIKVFTDKIKNLNSTLKDTRDRARDAPGHNVSHSDTSRFQLSNLSLGIEKQILEYRQILEQLKNLPIKFHGRISIGSLFTLFNIENNEEKTFFMLYQGGGEKIIINDTEIITLSVTAPISQLCFNKEIDEEVKFRNSIFEIIKIQ